MHMDADLARQASLRKTTEIVSRSEGRESKLNQIE